MSKSSMPAEVTIGQSWSVWVPSRRQWLLATVIQRSNGQATLAYDQRYEIDKGLDQRLAEETMMLRAPNLFRFVEAAA